MDKIKYHYASNHLLYDKTVSDKAYRIWGIIKSQEKNTRWSFSIRGLASLTGKSPTTVQSAIKELVDKGYLSVNQHQGRNKGGKFIAKQHGDYVANMIPLEQGSPCNNSPCNNSPCNNLPCTVNLPQINKDIINKDLNKKREEDISSSSSSDSLPSDSGTVSSANAVDDLNVLVQGYGKKTYPILISTFNAMVEEFGKTIALAMVNKAYDSEHGNVNGLKQIAQWYREGSCNLSAYIDDKPQSTSTSSETPAKVSEYDAMMQDAEKGFVNFHDTIRFTDKSDLFNTYTGDDFSNMILKNNLSEIIQELEADGDYFVSYHVEQIYWKYVQKHIEQYANKMSQPKSEVVDI